MNFCDKFGIDFENEQNEEKYLKLNFFHELFTGRSVSDCSYGGAFEVRYFWHWITPNPRYSILKLPEKIPLHKVKPPKRFGRYKNYASIDRIPSLFLEDLVSETPKYSHPGCSDFYTFGWCSEREMSFSLLLSLYGYESKVKQEGIHVWSSFWVTFEGNEGQRIPLVALVDNTFDIFEWQSTSGMDIKEWAEDFGSGQSVEWYNKTVKSQAEKDIVAKIEVKNKAAKRLKMLIRNYLDKFTKQ